VDAFSGLLAEYVKLKDADAILRGVRNSGEFELEHRYAACNAAFSGAETIFIPAALRYFHVSSTIVKEAAAHIYGDGLDDSFIAEVVHPAVRDALEKVFRRMR